MVIADVQAARPAVQNLPRRGLPISPQTLRPHTPLKCLILTPSLKHPVYVLLQVPSHTLLVEKHVRRAIPSSGPPLILAVQRKILPAVLETSPSIRALTVFRVADARAPATLPHPFRSSKHNIVPTVDINKDSFVTTALDTPPLLARSRNHPLYPVYQSKCPTAAKISTQEIATVDPTPNALQDHSNPRIRNTLLSDPQAQNSTIYPNYSPSRRRPPQPSRIRTRTPPYRYPSPLTSPKSPRQYLTALLYSS